MTTEAINDTSQWFERDLDDFLKEIHREDDEPDPNKLQEEEEERILPVIEITEKVFKRNTGKIMEDFDKWEFDIFKYCEALNEKTILHFGFKLFHLYGLLGFF
jgi:hypothetical protein